MREEANTGLTHRILSLGELPETPLTVACSLCTCKPWMVEYSSMTQRFPGPAIHCGTMSRVLHVAVGVVVVAGILMLRAVEAQQPARSPNAAPGIAAQVYYLGRDALTGRATTVGDRYIAERRESFERYYVEDREPVPPPPPGPVDIARIAIPALGLDAPVGRYGLDAAGRLDVPQDTATVGWNPAYSTLPGQGGSTFFAAHYEYQGVPGVFFRLSSLGPGDEIIVTLSDGSARRYRVTSTVDYALASIDMGALLRGREGAESITLMTCSGPGDGGRYPLRTVVLAEAID